MLSSLIVQLCGSRPECPQPLLDLGEYRDTNRRPDLETLENTLRATIADFDNVYLVVDGLDECPVVGRERQKLLECLLRIYRWGEINLHLFLTSRKENDINDKLCYLLRSESAVEIDLEFYKDSINHDIGIFIDESLDNSKMNKWPEETKELIRSTLITKADAM
jgi:hypothetical protein